MRSHVATAILTAIPVAVIAYALGGWHPWTADGDPVGHRNYSNYEGPVKKAATAKIGAIPAVCFEHSDQCKWTIDFETSPRELPAPADCETDYCLQISGLMQRTEEDEDGNAIGGAAPFYLRATISAFPPPKNAKH